MTYPRDPTERLPQASPAVEREEVVERHSVERVDNVARIDNKVRVVRTVCAVIDVICWVFAVVLAVHIFLVVAGANMGNGFAQFIAGFAGGVNLGLNDLFTPASEKVAVLLNEGLAAILWLVIAALLTNLITRVALPAEERRAWYRSRVR